MAGQVSDASSTGGLSGPRNPLRLHSHKMLRPKHPQDQPLGLREHRQSRLNSHRFWFIESIDPPMPEQRTVSSSQNVAISIYLWPIG